MFKKRSIILFMVSLSFFVQAQETILVDSIKRNELHLNLLTSLSYGFVEISYERILTKNSSVGLSAFVPVIKHNTYAYGFIPYYRYFLGKSVANGLFLEGNLGLLARKNNFIVNLYGGVVRLLNTNGDNVFPRAGVTVGKRF